MFMSKEFESYFAKIITEMIEVSMWLFMSDYNIYTPQWDVEVCQKM